MINLSRIICLVAALLVAANPVYAANPLLTYWKSGAAPPATLIVSIQPISITITSGNTTNTATISAVNTSYAALFNHGFTASSLSNVQSVASRLELTNATTVTCTRGASNADAVTCNGVVVEFTSSAINSITAGTINLSTIQTSNTATISAVGATSFVIWLGASSATSQTSYSRVATSVDLTNTTTVTAHIGIAGSDMTVGYMVVDPKSALVTSVQSLAKTDATSATSYTDTITTVAPEHTILINNGDIIATGTSASTFDHTRALTNATTVTYTRGSGAATNSRTSYTSAVEFSGGALNGSIQRFTKALSAAATGTSAINAITTAKTFVNYAGFLTTGSTPATTFPRITLTNGTTVTTDLNSSGTATVSASAIQFN